MKKSRTKLRKFLKVFSIIIVFVVIAVFSLFFSIYFSAKLNKGDVISNKEDITLYASNNEVIENENISRYVKYDDISPNIINAFIALEDKRFFKHDGIDYYRSMGALYNNLKSGYKKEGGSTITQQLVKNTLLSSQKTFVRKIKELKLAKDIEKQFSKEEILEMYLNAIYFGNGIYGIDSACKNYFNKKTDNVTIAEGAYLAGIVKSPQNYSPLNNLTKSTERKNLVLKLMYEQGIISETDYEQNTNYVYIKPEERYYDEVSPYYQNTIVEGSQLLGIEEKDLMQNGYKIYTYYENDVQNVLYNAFLSREYDCVNENGNTGSYLAMISNNKNGGIVGYFCNFNNSIFNFRRQPASALKPILVYAPAIEAKKVTPATPVLDDKVNINGYSPENYAGNYLGWIDVQSALKVSSNAVSVKLLNDVGIDYSKTIAEKMGIEFSKGDNGLSLALGGMENGVSFPELNSAYMCLANMGKYAKNSFIRAIYDKNNRLVYSAEPISSNQVISKETAYLVTDMLCQTTEEGTARKLADLGCVAGKTGTNTYPSSKNNLDAWCMSYTKDVTMCVWYGALDNTLENSVTTTGGNYPALLSRYIYRVLELKNEPFTIPEGIISLDIDNYALQNEHKLYLSNMFTPEECTKKVYFDADNAPDKYSPYFDFDVFNFTAVTSGQENLVNIKYKCVKPYKTKLFRRNMFTNELSEIPVEEKNGEVQYFDLTDEFCVYNYYVEFYYGDKRLNYTPSELVFT